MARPPKYLDSVETGIIIDALAFYKAAVQDGHALKSQIGELLTRFKESD